MQSVGIDVGAAGALSINVAREMKIGLYPDATEALFLRVIDREKAEQDFASLRILKGILAQYGVFPTEVVNADKLACGIFPFVPHERVSYQLLSQARYFSQVTDVLVRLHAGADQFPDGSRRFDISTTFGGVGGGALSDAFFRYVERSYQPIMASKNAFPQHCDFTYVNLGTDADGTLRVFDWEDFGSIRYAGFDLATFVLSHLFHGDLLHLMTTDPSVFTGKVRADVGDDVLARLGFTAEQFTQVFPGHLALFMGIKTDFGDLINRRLIPIWTQMMHSEKWQRILDGAVA